MLTRREVSESIIFSAMKALILFISAGCILGCAAARGTETAQARLFCMSLQFQEGTTYGGTLDLSTVGGPPYNGELVPTFSSDSFGNPWGSGFALYYGGYGNIYGTLYVILPPFADVNSNGFADFFEVSQGVNATTSGYYTTDISTGTITANWQRSAGSKDGICQLDLSDDTYGDLGTYSCPFTLLEYTGPLSYTPGSNAVLAVVNLAQTGNTASTLQGPINFDKSSTDRFNTLTNQPGVWTNAAMQTLDFDNEVFARDPSWPTNYAGYVYFADGNPNTSAADYQLWVLSIDDTNDANANGIPNFSDDPASIMPPPRTPQLALSQGSTNLWLAISGDVGRTNLIQEISSLASTNWQTTLSFVATNDPQVISLPLPSNSPTFWRVLAQ